MGEVTSTQVAPWSLDLRTDVGRLLWGMKMLPSFVTPSVGSAPGRPTSWIAAARPAASAGTGTRPAALRATSASMVASIEAGFTAAGARQPARTRIAAAARGARMARERAGGLLEFVAFALR